MIFAPSNGQHFGATCTDDFSPLSRMILLNATRWRDISTGRPDWLGAFRPCPSRCVVMEDRQMHTGPAVSAGRCGGVLGNSGNRKRYQLPITGSGRDTGDEVDRKQLS